MHKSKLTKLLCLVLSLVMILGAAPLTAVAEITPVQETKYLYEKVEKLEQGRHYVIVVRHTDGKYYAVQMVDPEVEGIEGVKPPTPADAHTASNTNTAAAKDITDLIIEDSATGKTFLVGVDDTISWFGTKYIVGEDRDPYGLYCQTGVILQSDRYDGTTEEKNGKKYTKYLLLSQVVSSTVLGPDAAYLNGYAYSKYFGSGTPTPGLWTYETEYSGYNYSYNSSKGCGELYTIGSDGYYNNFLNFSFNDGNP